MINSVIQKLKIKTQNQPWDLWFFFLFLLFFTTNIRKVAWYFPIQGTFNEYTGIYVYISDIFLFLTIFFWIVFLLYNNLYAASNKYDNKLWITSVIQQLIHKICSTYLASRQAWNNHLTSNPKGAGNKNVPPASSAGRRRTFILQCYIIIPALLVTLSFLSILWSENKFLAFFRSIKLLEFYLLYLYIIYRLVRDIYQNVPPTSSARLDEASAKRAGRRRTILIKKFLKIIILVAIIQSIIGIIQFITQESIGIFWLKESLISPNIPGVAKIIFNGEKYIRAYGLFPHPNILGGFLVFSIILTIAYRKMFHLPHRQAGVEHLNILTNNYPHSKEDNNSFSGTTVKQYHSNSDTSIRLLKNIYHNIIKKCSTYLIGRQAWNIYLIADPSPSKTEGNNENVPRGTFLNIILITQIIALITTFSKSAWIGLIISIGYLYYRENVSFTSSADKRGTITSSPTTLLLKQKSIKRFHLPHRQAGVEHFRKIILLILIAIFAIYLSKPDLNSFFVKSLEERMIYLNVSRGTILDNPILGVGIGQYVTNMTNINNALFKDWQFQPVHNVFLEIWSELGIVGLLLFMLFIYKCLDCLIGKQGSRKNNSSELILCNNDIILSSSPYLIYFQAILLGFTFIMLFDHYFWDIQQGSILLWLTLGFIAGIKRK